MTHFDAFNGDADGICALHQLRLERPLAAVPVTGVKRDVALLCRIDAHAGDAVTALDISLDANRSALLEMLDRGVRVEYFDHHVTRNVPESPGLHAVIDASPEVCTSTLVDACLQGRHRLWAMVGAFGDNLGTVAHRLASSLGLTDDRIAKLQMLGESLNYNSYGDAESDLLVHPAELYALLHRHTEPFSFMESEAVIGKINEGRRRDMALALKTTPEYNFGFGAVHIMPDAAWSRRVRGIFANRLVSRFPERALAVLTPNERGGYVVSVRAPLRASQNAQQLCSRFPTGGGRVAAAGINHLPHERLPDFIREFKSAFAH